MLQKLGSAILWLLAFPAGKQPEFPVHCTGTRKLNSNHYPERA